MFSSEQYLNSIASERSNHLTLDRDGNVGINGIPGGELGLQVLSCHVSLERTFRWHDWKKLWSKKKEEKIERKREVAAEWYQSKKKWVFHFLDR